MLSVVKFDLVQFLVQTCCYIRISKSVYGLYFQLMNKALNSKLSVILHINKDTVQCYFIHTALGVSKEEHTVYIVMACSFIYQSVCNISISRH